MSGNRKKVKNILIAIIWLVIWEVTSLIVHNRILLVGPADVLLTIAHKCIEADFWISVITSFGRIAAGFVSGFALAIVLAYFSWKSELFRDAIAPLMSFLKAAPVASFVVLFLIWWHSDVLAVAIVISVTLPQIYVGMLQGLNSTSQNLKEMADVFELHAIDRLHYIYRPAVRHNMEASIKMAAAMAWKSGVAAEVIGTPEHTLGTGLYMSKIYLDTSGVLAITVVVIILSILWEKAILALYRCYNNWQPGCLGSRSISDSINRNIMEASTKEQYVELKNVTFSYDGNVTSGEKHIVESVVNDMSVTYKKGSTYILDGPSGSGKTTLLHILSGLITPDAGEVIRSEGMRLSMVFQDDRLCEEASAVKNVALVCGNDMQAREILGRLIETADMDKPVSELSGGERRRVCIARAIAMEADILLLDEPYVGLDEENIRKVKELINEDALNRITVIATHIGSLEKYA